MTPKLTSAMAKRKLTVQKLFFLELMLSVNYTGQQLKKNCYRDIVNGYALTTLKIFFSTF